jgi:DNA topoisomerase-6 subunit B
MLNKPVPSLNEVITKIMDVVWIEDLIEYEKISGKPVQKTLLEDSLEGHKEGIITKSNIMVVNYMRKPQKFNLYVVIPEDAVVGTVTPKPTRIANNYIKWNLGSIHPTGKIDVHFELAGLGKGDFDENDMYIENINPSYVIGADKWEGE